MAKALTDEMYSQLNNKKTKTGFTASNLIQVVNAAIRSTLAQVIAAAC